MAEYSSDEVSTICGEIKKRIEGGMGDEDFTSFKKMITPLEVIPCRQCQGSGVFEENYSLIVCRECDYHRVRGRTLSVSEPSSISKGK